MRLQVSDVACLLMPPIIFIDTSTTKFYTLSLHDALPIFLSQTVIVALGAIGMTMIMISGGIDLSVGACIALTGVVARSEEHTSELQSQSNLVCRLLLEKKKNMKSQG